MFLGENSENLKCELQAHSFRLNSAVEPPLLCLNTNYENRRKISVAANFAPLEFIPFTCEMKTRVTGFEKELPCKQNRIKLKSQGEKGLLDSLRRF